MSLTWLAKIRLGKAKDGCQCTHPARVLAATSTSDCGVTGSFVPTQLTRVLKYRFPTRTKWSKTSSGSLKWFGFRRRIAMCAVNSQLQAVWKCFKNDEYGIGMIGSCSAGGASISGRNNYWIRVRAVTVSLSLEISFSASQFETDCNKQHSPNLQIGGTECILYTIKFRKEIKRGQYTL